MVKQLFFGSKNFKIKTHLESNLEGKIWVKNLLALYHVGFEEAVIKIANITLWVAGSIILKFNVQTNFESNVKQSCVQKQFGSGTLYTLFLRKQ